MKKIPLITVLFWIACSLGFWGYPGLVKQDIIQFPCVLLLSVLLPVSFWQLAKHEKKKYLSLLFLGIFFVNASFFLVVMRDSFTIQQQVTEELYAGTGIQQEFAEYLVTAISGNKRKIAAQLIYLRHGVALPFKNDTGSYSLYEPTEQDKKRFQENFFALNDLKLKSRGIAVSFVTASLLLFIHVGLFIMLLAFLTLYDPQHKGKKE